MEVCSLNSLGFGSGCNLREKSPLLQTKTLPSNLALNIFLKTKCYYFLTLILSLKKTLEFRRFLVFVVIIIFIQFLIYNKIVFIIN